MHTFPVWIGLKIGRGEASPSMEAEGFGHPPPRWKSRRGGPSSNVLAVRPSGRAAPTTAAGGVRRRRGGRSAAGSGGRSAAGSGCRSATRSRLRRRQRTRSETAARPRRRRRIVRWGGTRRRGRGVDGAGTCGRPDRAGIRAGALEHRTGVAALKDGPCRWRIHRGRRVAMARRDHRDGMIVRHPGLLLNRAQRMYRTPCNQYRSAPVTGSRHHAGRHGGAAIHRDDWHGPRLMAHRPRVARTGANRVTVTRRGKADVDGPAAIAPPPGIAHRREPIPTRSRSRNSRRRIDRACIPSGIPRPRCTRRRACSSSTRYRTDPNPGLVASLGDQTYP